ncbi:hypothetical protein BaRGS_00016875 [Batillaria attramentaria]|uniref:Exonuclease domain-containing protein n=1 Tax=Batillaria attramentaria TaxID=370345 RepID=A0ABD0KXU0_9CAEN
MASFSGDLAKEVQRSKKDKRLEAKKKKAVALLKLIEMNASEEPPAKKARSTQDSAQQKMVAGASDAAEQNKKLSDDEYYAKARQVVIERRKAAMEKPKIFLTLEDLLPHFTSSKEEAKDEGDAAAGLDTNKVEQKTPPLFMMDLQHLIMYALMKNLSSYMPRWCKLLRPSKMSSVVLVVVHDVSIEDFQTHPECFPFIKEHFPTYVEMVSPSQYGSSLDLDPNTTGDSGTEQVAGDTSDGSEKTKDSLVPDDDDAKSDLKTDVKTVPTVEDAIPRTTLMLNTTQMMAEGYPVPVTTSNQKYADFTFSKDRYDPVKPTSPMFALDCEMCLTCIRQNELTRVSVVNEHNDVIYDRLVKPRNRIINYLTKWSGITKAMLDPVTTRIEDVQRELSQLLPRDAILCGQSLWNDLCALKMFHPYVIDTSVIYNMSGSRSVKCGLKRLSNLFLGRTIQDSKDGHCSAEDATATMDLVKLKLSLDFGDAVLGGVYFPDMKTYFLRPSAAQNVQETFHANNTTHNKALSNAKNAGGEGAKNGKNAVTAKIEDTLQKMRGLEMDQRKVFFQQKGNTLMLSLFELLADNHISVGLIGNKELVSKYRTEPKLKAIALETDKECCKEAAAVCQEKDFTWVNLTAFADKVSAECSEDDGALEEEERKKIFSKLDKRVRKLVGKLRERSLAIVVITGRSSRGQHSNAATFVTIT